MTEGEVLAAMMVLVVLMGLYYLIRIWLLLRQDRMFRRFERTAWVPGRSSRQVVRNLLKSL